MKARSFALVLLALLAGGQAYAGQVLATEPFNCGRRLVCNPTTHLCLFEGYQCSGTTQGARASVTATDQVNLSVDSNGASSLSASYNGTSYSCTATSPAMATAFAAIVAAKAFTIDFDDINGTCTYAAATVSSANPSQ